jgi:hypothetical protein
LDGRYESFRFTGIKMHDPKEYLKNLKTLKRKWDPTYVLSLQPIAVGDLVRIKGTDSISIVKDIVHPSHAIIMSLGEAQKIQKVYLAALELLEEQE